MIYMSCRHGLRDPSAFTFLFFIWNKGKSFALFHKFYEKVKSAKVTTNSTLPASSYSLYRKIKLLMRLAPAKTQSLDSHLIFSRITDVGACLFLKTLAFLSFQSSHGARRVMEAKSFRFVTSFHKSWIGSVGYRCRSMKGSPSQGLISPQSLMV
jgi:hypothetical protein